jgi:glycosyltransferase involved in cell wall biosynthesis
MPVRDMGTTIGAQLAALARQDYPGIWELVVVDNGSRDDSMAVVDRWRERLPMRVLQADAVAECGYAKSAGAAIALGELLVFCDADDEVRPDWLRAMVGALQRAPLVAGVFDYVKLNPPEIAAKYERADYTAPRWGYLPSGTGANLGVRRSLFEQLGRFRVGSRADTALCWRAQLAGYQLVFEPAAVVDRRLKALTPRRMFVLSIADGRAIVRHYQEFRAHGMRRSPLRDVVYDYGMVPVQLATGRRFEAAQIAGTRLGRWIGSIRLRSLCP